MMLVRDRRFLAQAEELRLRYCCEDCACFDPEAETCAHGFPLHKHRASTHEDMRAPLAFCKEHDLI